MKALIIDGNSVLNRSFYGIKLLSNKKGQYTNAIYGFLTTFQKIKDEFSPDAVAVAFDMPGPTFRKDIFTEYKAQRKGMPDELASQMPILKRLLKLLGYKIVQCSGYEADDILGTLSVSFSEQGHLTLIATGDRDSLQLVSENTLVRIASTKHGKAESTLYDVGRIKEVYGVSPKELIEIKALQGDTSDNIPGVKGIGQKTAESLIQNYKSIDNIYDNIDSPDIRESVKKKLIEGKDNAYMSKKLGTICTSVPIETDINLYIPAKPDSKDARALMTELEFYSLIDKVCPNKPKDEIPNSSDKPKEKIKAEKISKFDDLIKDVEKTGCKVSVHAEFKEDKISFMALCGADKLYYIDNINNNLGEPIKNFLENENINKVVYDLKGMINGLNKADIKIKGVSSDIMLSAYILNPSASNYGLGRLCEEYRIDNADIEDAQCYSDSQLSTLKSVVLISRLEKILSNELIKNHQEDLLSKIELPLSYVLADMEIAGFRVDKEGLSEYDRVLSDKICEIQAQIYKSMGFEFNINSPKQLGIALFEDLGLPKRKKNKTGYSTSAQVLESLINYHPAIAMILQFRALSKLKSTYCDGMIKLINPSDGRIHAYFNQIETRTGRISCTDPNLQNIPVRTQAGRKLRKYFCADDSCVLVDADYSQIELRILAHLSDDKNMIDAFNSNEDIHTLTASKIFNIPVSMIGSEARTRAKSVNFGIIYGIGAFSLSQDLGISRAEADGYIKAYLQKYKGVDEYLKVMVENAKSNGYAETMFNRRRYLPELSSSNFNLRSFGERVARNMPIQGTAADIIKIAMIKVNNKLKEGGFKARIILQVHDELIVETPTDEVMQVKRILKENMENAVNLRVPLTVNISSGKTWYDAKD